MIAIRHMTVGRARASVVWLAPALCFFCGCAAKAPPAVALRPAGPWINLAKAADGTDVVEVTGLDPTALAAWASDHPTEESWHSLFTVEVGETTILAGRYEAAKDVLRFAPRYPLLHNGWYRAILHPRELPGAGPDVPPVKSVILRPPRPSDWPAPAVVHVYPSADKLPDNLLRVYVHFSTPMQRGDVYQFIRLLDANGQQVPSPFVEIPEELWDPSGKRLTLLLDPGRVKSGLKPREEAGPVLVAGREYTLVIEPTARNAAGGVTGFFCDEYGERLSTPHRVRFRAVAAETRPINVAEWTISAPPAGTRTPLSVAFGRTLDHALAHRVIRVVTAGGEPVDGDVKLGVGETSWHFTPRNAWAAGDYTLEADGTLEDVAGNRIGRAFEIHESQAPRDETPVNRRPFTVTARGR